MKGRAAPEVDLERCRAAIVCTERRLSSAAKLVRRAGLQSLDPDLLRTVPRSGIENELEVVSPAERLRDEHVGIPRAGQDRAGDS